MHSAEFIEQGELIRAAQILKISMPEELQNWHWKADTYNRDLIRESIMASSKEYLEFVLDQLSSLDDGIDDIGSIINDLRIKFVKEHSFTPEALVNELAPLERLFFKLLFTGKIYRKIYRLYELKA